MMLSLIRGFVLVSKPIAVKANKYRVADIIRLAYIGPNIPCLPVPLHLIYISYFKVLSSAEGDFAALDVLR
jgi:hypothetical protein